MDGVFIGKQTDLGRRLPCKNPDSEGRISKNGGRDGSWVLRHLGMPRTPEVGEFRKGPLLEVEEWAWSG